MDEIRPITGWFTKNISKLSSLLMGTRGPPRGECVLPQLLPLCNKPRFEVLDQFSICCFIVHFARLIEEASGFLRRLDLNLRSFFNLCAPHSSPKFFFWSDILDKCFQSESIQSYWSVIGWLHFALNFTELLLVYKWVDSDWINISS